MNLEMRGKCEEMSQTAVDTDPTLTLVRGWYHCPIWGPEEHWWTTRTDGSIYDPTMSQYPSAGLGEYEPFTGTYPCEQCGIDVPESDVVHAGRFVVCSQLCYGRMVGVFA